MTTELINTDSIEITDVGPVEHLRIPLPAGGGLVVLKGANDAGKSETLKAVNALVSGNGSIEKRDGSSRGEIRLGEARMTVVKQTRRDVSELVATTLDGKLNLADLVNGKWTDPEKADKERIKALVQLSGVTPDITLFHALAGGKEAFDEIVSPEAAEADDVVTMAAKVKRDLEAAARKAHDQAENFTGNALGHREAALGYDPDVESDAGKLHAALEEAIREEQRIVTERNEAEQHNHDIAKAREALEAAQKSSAFPPLAEAMANEALADKARKDAEQEVALLSLSLREARSKLSRLESALALATKSRMGAEQHEKTLAAWAETAKLHERATNAEAVTAARLRTDEARKAVDAGALQRDKRDRTAKADAADRLALEARRKSERLRDAARGTDEVLSGLVGKCGTGLWVERGRLVTKHERGTTPYSELSDGTRWKMAIDIGIDALARMGTQAQRMLLTIPQVAFSELQPRNRRLIHEHAKARGVHILTALASDDEEITAEVYGVN